MAKKYVIYGIEDARDGYYVSDYRLTDSDDLHVWNEYAELMKEFAPSTKTVYVVLNSEEIKNQYDDLRRKAHNHFEDRMVFKMTLESEAIAVRRF